MQFSEVIKCKQLLENLKTLNFTELTPIQEKTFSTIRNHGDLFGIAQTGTGKTAAYILPLMESMRAASTDDSALVWKREEYVLVLAPTRELVEQIYNFIIEVNTGLEFKAVKVYGGVSYEPQIKQLSESFDFLVATPGRLIDLYKDSLFALKSVKSIVFDEADRMFDMGFKKDVFYILDRVQKSRQILMFSATNNFDVLNSLYNFGSAPLEVNISQDSIQADYVTAELLHVSKKEKPMYLYSLLQKYSSGQAIVFTNFKNNVDRICDFLNSNDIPAVGLSSLLNQNQRNRVIVQFKDERKFKVLVATDVAARGIDISGVDIVVNYEMPMNAETYVHRIGRTGRAEREGVAFSLSGEDDVDSLMRVENYLGKKIPIGWLDSEDLSGDYVAFPRFGGFLERKSEVKKIGARSKHLSRRGRDFKEREQTSRSYEKRKTAGAGGGVKDYSAGGSRTAEKSASSNTNRKSNRGTESVSSGAKTSKGKSSTKKQSSSQQRKSKQSTSKSGKRQVVYRYKKDGLSREVKSSKGFISFIKNLLS